MLSHRLDMTLPVRKSASTPARVRAALAIASALALAACASGPAPVEDRSLDEPPPRRAIETAPTRPAPPGGSYRVVKGDTLYSIAFKRGLDYRDVAAWNGIAAPAYKILVGQDIRFSPPSAQAATTRPPTTPAATPNPAPAATASAPSVAPAAKSPAPAPASTTKSGGMFEDVPTESAHAPPAVSAPPSTATAPPPAAAAPPAPSPASLATTAAAAASVAMPAAAPAKPTEAPASAPAKALSESASSNVNGIAWRWPSTGKVVGSFVGGDQTKQGLDIAGKSGDPVQAAADGDVVYSGNGLLGYGELIIVKHNASFLSAYGHNRKRLVAEGDHVRAGQPIAEMGSSASSRDELHFEIRKNGKPVNPLDYLPAK
jgi:lipoprotein NlpD